MRLYQQQDIDNLIGCPKVIVEPPKREMRLEAQHQRNGMRLKAEHGDLYFRVFMRVHYLFNENFSIGLVYLAPEGGEIHLLRCNGPHGEYNENYEPGHPHSEYHVHRATERAMQEGRRPEKYAERTEAFASYREAVRYFVKMVNLGTPDVVTYFPDVLQGNLPFGPGAGTV